jgi:hypothetical protein
MSEAPPDNRPAHRKRVEKIAEAITFVLFIGTLVSQTPVVMAIAALWPVMALALPLFWRGAFTFAIRGSVTQEEFQKHGLREPRQITALTLVGFALGLAGTFALWGGDLLTVLLAALALGGVLFVAIYAVDPPIRTTKQAIFLAVQCLAWGIGTFAAILGLIVA